MSVMITTQQDHLNAPSLHSASYECLGDAYLAYGAHTAALKVFTKASEINPNALYPLYQIAHIKQVKCRKDVVTAQYF